MPLFKHVMIISAILNVCACAVNPVTGKKELSLISPSQEVAMGTKNYLPYQQQQGGRYIVDPDLGLYVNALGKKLASVSDRPGLPYEFVVLNNSVPNAWALPGGKIALNRGLLLELQDEAQLAAVIGHEIVHVAAKHSVNQMQQAQLAGVLVLATAVAAKDSQYGSSAALLAAGGAAVWQAKYGQDQELQSDEVGIAYMVKAGYDPYAAIELQETFLRLSKGRKSNWLEGLFASHPPSQTRVDKNRTTAQSIGLRGNRNRDGFQRAIAQLKRDKAAYDLHDKAMAAIREKDETTALGLLDQAIAKQNQEALFHVTKGQILLNKNLDSRAAAAFSEAKKLNPEYFMGHLGLGVVEYNQNRRASAKQNLLRSQKFLETQTAAYYLGEIELAEGNRKQALAYFDSAAQQGGELGEKAQQRVNQLRPAPANVQ
ncbi:MAG: M48 family metalloprotease [Agarilytica sp.]